MDAAVFGNQYIEIGCLIHNDIGAFIHGFSKRILGSFTPKEAKALGIREALSWTNHHQYDNFVLESYALQMVQDILYLQFINLVGLCLDDVWSMLKHFNHYPFRR